MAISSILLKTKSKFIISVCQKKGAGKSEWKSRDVVLHLVQELVRHLNQSQNVWLV